MSAPEAVFDPDPAGAQPARPAQPIPGEPAAQVDAPDEASALTDDPDTVRQAVEAVLFVVDEPVASIALAQGLGVPMPSVQRALEALRGEYAESGRAFELREVAGGWRMYTRAEFAPHVERFLLEGHQARLTQAALETLAVVAYRQPVSRSRVAAVRGVNVDGVMRTLTTRGLVVEAGTDPHTGAVLYATSEYFLERLGLSGLSQLPPLADFLPESTTIDALEAQLSSEGIDE